MFTQRFNDLIALKRDLIRLGDSFKEFGIDVSFERVFREINYQIGDESTKFNLDEAVPCLEKTLGLPSFAKANNNQ